MENSIKERLENIQSYKEEYIPDYEKYRILKDEKDFNLVDSPFDNDQIKYSDELNVFAIERGKDSENSDLIFIDIENKKVTTIDGYFKTITNESIEEFKDRNENNSKQYEHVKNYIENIYVKEENDLTQKVAELVEDNAAPWMKEQEAGVSYLPYNMENGNEYQGMNLVKLMSENHDDPRFLTHKQADSLGLVLKDGELPTKVKYYKDEDILKQILSEPHLMEYIASKREQPTVKDHYVYNASQFENVPELDHSKLNLPNERVEEVIRNSGININHEANANTLYTPGNNTLTVKPREEFNDINEYYRNVIGGIVGAKLDNEISNGEYSVDKNSSKADLIKEMSTFIINSELQIGHTPNINNLSNIKEWSSDIRYNQDFLKDVAKQSDKIVDLVIGNSREDLIKDRNKEFNSHVLESKREAINENDFIKVSSELTIENISNTDLAKSAKEVLSASLDLKIEEFEKTSKLNDKYFTNENVKENLSKTAEDLKEFKSALEKGNASVEVGIDINDRNEEKLIFIVKSNETTIIYDMEEDDLLLKNSNNENLIKLNLQDEIVDENQITEDGFEEVMEINLEKKEAVLDEKIFIFTEDIEEFFEEREKQQQLNQSNSIKAEPKLIDITNTDLAKTVTSYIENISAHQNKKDLENAEVNKINSLDPQKEIYTGEDFHAEEMAEVIFDKEKENYEKIDSFSKELKHITSVQYDKENDEFILKSENATIKFSKFEITFEDNNTKELVKQTIYPNDKELSNEIKEQQALINSQKENAKPEQVKENIQENKASEKLYFSGAYEFRKEIVKAGGQYDKNAKSWYIKSDSGLKLEDFEKFAKKTKVNAKEEAMKNLDNNKKENKFFLAVPFSEKNEAKNLGAMYDGERKSWYCKESEKANFSKWDPDKQITTVQSVENSEERFLSRLHELGVTENSLIGDGDKHRIQVEGDKGREKSGFYVYHSDGVPTIYFKNHRTGVEEKIVDKGIQRTPEEKEKYYEMVKAKKLQKEQELAVKREKASENLKFIYSKSENVKEHEYLDKKNIKPSNDIKITQKGDMMIPVYDIEGNLKSAQYIKNDGSKIFAKDCDLSDTMHVIDKEFNKLEKSDVVIVSEGYATAKTIHEAMRENGERDIPVVAAMSAGSLEKAIDSIKKKFPEKKIIIGADNDLNKSVNTGLEAAEKAAAKFKDVSFITPKKEGIDFNGDFNDLVSKDKDRPKEKALKEISDNIKSKVKEINKDKVKDNVQEKTHSQTLEKSKEISNEKSNVITNDDLTKKDKEKSKGMSR